MKAFGLLVLLVGSALSAPQEVQEAKEAKAPKARQLYSQEALVPQPQFGARLAPQAAYYSGSYQQAQYIPGQQFSYYSGAPAQAFYSGAASRGYYQPQYYQSQYYQPQYYQSQYYQPQANIVAAKKTIKPAVYHAATPVPAAAFSYSPAPAFKVAAAPVPALKVAAAPAPALLKAAAPHAPQPAQYSAEPNHVILKQVQDDNFDGSFNYGYETDHGIAVESSGFVKNAGTEDQIQVIQGSYTYYTPEGVPVVTTYIADENGFQVQGDHLPVAPALPEAIAKSIEYQRSLPPSVEDEPQTVIPARPAVIAARL